MTLPAHPRAKTDPAAAPQGQPGCPYPWATMTTDTRRPGLAAGDPFGGPSSILGPKSWCHLEADSGNGPGWTVGAGVRSSPVCPGHRSSKGLWGVPGWMGWGCPCPVSWPFQGQNQPSPSSLGGSRGSFFSPPDSAVAKDRRVRGEERGQVRVPGGQVASKTQPGGWGKAGGWGGPRPP